MRAEIASSPASLTVGPQAEPIQLWPQRAVYWPAAQTLLLSDLHWGREIGPGSPAGVPEADLCRLNALLAATGADRVVFLGDLVHGRHGLTPQLAERIRQWRVEAADGLELILVPGNHDRPWKKFPASWQIEVRSDVMTEGPFAFAHRPAPVPGHFTWAGHIHPVTTHPGGDDTLRLPCFHLTGTLGILPAFGQVSRGQPVQPQPGDRVFAVSNSELLEL